MYEVTQCKQVSEIIRLLWITSCYFTSLIDHGLGNLRYMQTYLFSLNNGPRQQTQNFVSTVFNVGPTLYKCYTNVLRHSHLIIRDAHRGPPSWREIYQLLPRCTLISLAGNVIMQL